MSDKYRVAVIMGSDSDLPAVEPCFDIFDKFDIPFDAMIMSAHRTPAAAAEFAANARKNGYGVIIAAAGKAAHLAGAIAANTTLPVIGIPMKSSTLDGLDALLSTVQMPSGIPVATVAIDGAANAALLAVQILSLCGNDESGCCCENTLAQALDEYKYNMANEVAAKNDKLSQKLAQRYTAGDKK